MRYSPLDLFGTYTGIMMTVLGLGQMLLNPLLTHAAGETMHGYAKYATLYSILGVLVAVSGAALLVYWRRFPLPAPGSTISSVDYSDDLPSTSAKDMDSRLGLDTGGPFSFQKQTTGHTLYGAVDMETSIRAAPGVAASLDKGQYPDRHAAMEAAGSAATQAMVAAELDPLDLKFEKQWNNTQTAVEKWQAKVPKEGSRQSDDTEKAATALEQNATVQASGELYSLPHNPSLGDVSPLQTPPPRAQDDSGLNRSELRRQRAENAIPVGVSPLRTPPPSAQLNSGLSRSELRKQRAENAIRRMPTPTTSPMNSPRLFEN